MLFKRHLYVPALAHYCYSPSPLSILQIDDFLNGKSPLSVAIRVGESVVVVNLHRAKVEEIEIEPPPPKRHCHHRHARSRRFNDDIDYPGPSPSSSTSSPVDRLSCLNSNPHSLGDIDSAAGINPFHPPRPFSRLASARADPPTCDATPTASFAADSKDEPCCSSSVIHSSSVSRSVQTEPERKSSSREISIPEHTISMKRKAIMEAISEILKKMYANSEKGRLPGSFKGRFSSEFTCDGDMREILHTKTTMTSYGSDANGEQKGRERFDSAGHPLCENAMMSKARLEENQQLRDKVATLKWQMQQKRALKLAKRRGTPSPCGWMEALQCTPTDTPRLRKRTGFCGLKRGFLLSETD